MNFNCGRTAILISGESGRGIGGGDGVLAIMGESPELAVVPVMILTASHAITLSVMACLYDGVSQ